MTDNRIALRINETDRANLLAIAKALHGKRLADPSPWAPDVNITRCLRTALKVAAQAARNGTLPDGSFGTLATHRQHQTVDEIAARIQASGAKPAALRPSNPSTTMKVKAHG